ncbi:hypothetical protein GALL_549560 [mine drainage metagenome]|uniref:Uncharacterized protein n=1 Tax=mine drainage metagenome TaxID=410659 RepID=A0A1J5NZ36_9ZZZZ
MQVQRRRQRPIAHRPPIDRMHRPVRRRQRVRRDLELLRRRRDQNAAHLCRRVQNCGSAVLHRMAAGGEALVRSPPRIGGYQIDVRHRNVQLFRRHLQQRGLQPLPQFHLTGEHGHPPVRRDPDPGVQRRRPLQAAGAGGFFGAQRKRNRQTAAECQKPPARQDRGHDFTP